MLRNIFFFLFISFTVLYSDLINVHVFWSTFLRIYWLDVLEKLSISLIVLSESGIYVASYTMSVSGISGAVVPITLFFVFVDVVERFFRWFRSLFLRRNALQIFIFHGLLESSSGLHPPQTLCWLSSIQRFSHLIVLSFSFSNMIDVKFQNFFFCFIVHINLSDCFHVVELSIVKILRELPFDSFPSILQVKFSPFSKI